MKYRVISADSHVSEPPHLWDKWLPPEYRKYAPKLVKDNEGGDAWQYGEGVPPAALGLIVVKRGRKYSDPDYKWLGVKMDECNQGAFYGEPRVKEQDEDGIDAEVLYAPHRGAVHFMAPGVAEIALAGVRANNDWLYKEYCAVNPQRLVGLALMPNAGIEASVSELERVHAMGAKGVSIMAWPSGGDNLGPEDDPFFATAERLGIPVSIHVQLAGKEGIKAWIASNITDTKKAQPVNPLVMMSTGTIANPPKLIAELIFSGLFDRFPKLQMVFGEINVGWIPAVLENMDDVYARDRYWSKTEIKKKPSDYWRSNLAATFIVDRYGIANRHTLGLETMLWSNDYPHHRCDWLDTQRIIGEHMAGVPAAEREAMLAGNAARIYKLQS
jgi:predicted TIM-barrel fold metal-dependent hydrolase